MNGLLHRLWTTAREWREGERDLRLLNRFLNSPSDRYEMVAKAKGTAPTQVFMLTLLRFVQSDMERLEVYTNGVVMWSSLPDELPGPAGVLAKWMQIAEIAGWSVIGTTLKFLTDTAPVLLDVRFPQPLDTISGDDLEAELKKLKIPAPCMVVSKVPVAPQGYP